MADNQPTGAIFAVQRFCVSDGPGIRTVVFFQGCPLRCIWCHNPESHSFHPFVSFRKESCLNCGKCQKLAPGSMCRRMPEKPCNACGACIGECPGGALTLQGRLTTPQELMQTILRDRFYYDESGGGLTLSGGEPCAQPEFSLALLRAAGEAKVHRAIETSGAVPAETVAALAPHCDLWLFDIKAAPTRCRELTGGDYAVIRHNLQYLSDNGASIRLRVPLVCGANMDEELLNELKSLRSQLKIEQIEILPYHDLGRGKAAMCGKTEPDWQRFSAPDQDTLTRWQNMLG